MKGCNNHHIHTSTLLIEKFNGMHCVYAMSQNNFSLYDSYGYGDGYGRSFEGVYGVGCDTCYGYGCEEGMQTDMRPVIDMDMDDFIKEVKQVHLVMTKLMEVDMEEVMKEVMEVQLELWLWGW